MRLIHAIIALCLTAPLSAAATAADTPAGPRAEDPLAQAVRSVAAARDVVVELSLSSGDVIVRGWDRNEVRARSDESPRIDLRQYDSAGAEGKGGPARRVEILVLSSDEDHMRPGESVAAGNVELNVPRGATVVLRVQSGDIEIAGVAEARVESGSGDVDISNVSKDVEVNAMSGDVSVANSQGGMRLRSMSGDVEATGVTTNDAKDFFTIKSVSGNINLEGVTHAKVQGETVSGSVSFQGALAPGGGYDLRTTSGDVTMTIPAESSFKVSARIIAGGDIITDFAVKADAKSVKVDKRMRLDGVVGGGDAEVTLTAFNGTVHLRKQ